MRHCRKTWLAVALCCATATLWASGDPEVEALRREVRILKLEVAYLQAESLARTVAALEGEAARAEERLRRLEKEERNLRDEIASVGRLGATASANERLELNATAADRELRPGSDLVRILTEKQDVAQRASELSRQLQWERQRWKAAIAIAERLQAASR